VSYDPPLCPKNRDPLLPRTSASNVSFQRAPSAPRVRYSAGMKGWHSKPAALLASKRYPFAYPRQQRTHRIAFSTTAYWALPRSRLLCRVLPVSFCR